MDDESCTSFYVLLICKMNLEITIMATWQIMLLIQAFSTLVSLGFICAFMFKKDEVSSTSASSAHEEHDVHGLSGVALA